MSQILKFALPPDLHLFASNLVTRLFIALIPWCPASFEGQNLVRALVMSAIKHCSSWLQNVAKNDIEYHLSYHTNANIPRTGTV